MGDPHFFKLTTADGTVYSYSSSLKNAINIVLGTRPGEKVTGQIAFEIPQSATPGELTYNDGLVGDNITNNLNAGGTPSQNQAAITGTFPLEALFKQLKTDSLNLGFTSGIR